MKSSYPSCSHILHCAYVRGKTIMSKITNTILASFPGITGEMTEAQVAALDKLFTVLGKQIDTVELDNETVRGPNGELLNEFTIGQIGVFGRQWSINFDATTRKLFKVDADGNDTAEIRTTTSRKKIKFTAI